MAGVGNVSSMLRAAASLQAKQVSYNDSVAAYEFANSGQTIDDYTKYRDYVAKQAGRSSDPTKQLTYQKTLTGAYKSFTSNEIQRSSIAVLEGGGTLQDKQGTIGKLYEGAMANGDLNLATNLRQQFDQIDVQLQKQADTAAAAAQTLAKTTGDKSAASYSTAASALKGGLQDLVQEYKMGGQQPFNKALTQFASDNAETLKAMGVTLPKGGGSNIGQVINGVVQAIGQYYTLAATATSVTNPATSEHYNSLAEDILTGAAKFETPAGSLDRFQIAQMANNPQGFVERQDPKTGQYALASSSVKGYAYDQGGKLQPIYTGTTEGTTLTKSQKTQLQNLGFKLINNGDNGEVQLTSNLNDKSKQGKFTSNWLPPDLINSTSNKEMRVYDTPQGLQFSSVDQGGKTHLYTVTQDQKGLSGVFETLSNGQNVHVHGEYGFNQTDNKLVNPNSSFSHDNILNSVVYGAHASDFNTRGSGLDPSTVVYESKLARQDRSKVVSTVNGQQYNFAGDPIGTPAPAATPTSGLPKTLTSAVSIPTAPTPPVSTPAYAQRYAAQLQATPTLDKNPTAVHTVLNGVSYNAAGDPIQ